MRRFPTRYGASSAGHHEDGRKRGPLTTFQSMGSDQNVRVGGTVISVGGQWQMGFLKKLLVPKWHAHPFWRTRNRCSLMQELPIRDVPKSRSLQWVARVLQASAPA